MVRTPIPGLSKSWAGQMCPDPKVIRAPGTSLYPTPHTHAGERLSSHLGSTQLARASVCVPKKMYSPTKTGPVGGKIQTSLRS